MKRRGWIERLAENPRAFTWLRKVAEMNFFAARGAIRSRLPARGGSRILDLGCGTGEMAPLFRSVDYLGLDPSLPYIRYARRRFPGAAFVVGDGTRIPLADRSCDGVLVFGVLHHLEDETASKILEEIVRVLKPAARLLLIEDRAEVAAWNLPGRWVHALDAGDRIRSRDGYRALFPVTRLIELEEFRFTSGICDYQGFVLQRVATL